MQVPLARTDLKISRLGFGTASLHHLYRRKQRLALLATAADCGITHFDTARMYGEGIAERSLGDLISGSSRHSFTVATKIGFPAHPVSGRVPMLMYAARAARVAARRLGLTPSSRRRALGTAEAERSLAASLAALRTDWIDLLLVHEPQPDEIPALHTLAEWMARQKAAGRARWLGLSGDAQVCVDVARKIPGLFDVLQVEDSLQGRQADAVVRAGWPWQITFGYLRIACAEANDAHRAEPLSIIGEALKRNASGAILVSTRRPERLVALSRVARDERIP